MASTEQIWMVLDRMNYTQIRHGFLMEKILVNQERMIKILETMEKSSYSRAKKSNISSLLSASGVFQWSIATGVVIYALNGGDIGKILSLLLKISG